MNTDSRYLGLHLKNPLLAGASPLPDHIDSVRRLEDSGASAITMYSLFEEDVTETLEAAEAHIGAHEDSFAEATTYFPRKEVFDRNVDTYLERLRLVDGAVDIPVIASLNGTREGEWVDYARQMEAAGAAALELNLYFLSTDADESAADLEERCVRIVRSVRERIGIPLAVKLSPFFTSLPHFARRLVTEAGADALVLFNRFYQPDIDVEELDVTPALELSHSNELRLRLRWIGLLRPQLDCGLSISGGVHTGIDLIKAVMSGADSVQVVSTLLINGPEQIGRILDEAKEWMAENEYDSFDRMRGSMSYARCPDPEKLERANYRRVLQSWRPKFVS